MAKRDWTSIQDFTMENKGLFFLVADPRSDEILMTFNGLAGFTRFPMESMDKGVVFNALRKSKFDQAIDAFMTGVIEATGINEKEKEGNELLKVLGGGVKALGVESKRSALEVLPKAKYGKKTSKKR